MLDSNKDSQKLEAMKMIIGVCVVPSKQCLFKISSFLQMVAKGKDCTDLFPAVVKNVVSKNSEVIPSLLVSTQHHVSCYHTVP